MFLARMMPRGLAGPSRTSAPSFLYQARVRDLSRHQQASHGLLSSLGFFFLPPGLIQGSRSCCRLILLDHGCGDQSIRYVRITSLFRVCLPKRLSTVQSYRARALTHLQKPPLLWLARIINLK
jgi:hypothetical protein